MKMYKKLEEQRSFKTSNNLYAIARQNEKMWIGDQWDGINRRNLDTNTYNFIGKTMEIKNASILANELAINRTAEEIDEDNEHVQKAIKCFNLADRKNWERLQMDAMNEQFILNASIEGLGVSYWYWDNDIESGNTVKVKGDINGQLIDSVNFYVANPAEVDVQKQPWIILTVDMTNKELQQYAKDRGVSKEKANSIMPDEQEITYRAYEKADYQQLDKDEQLSTLMICFKKEEGMIYKAEMTKDIMIEDWKDIDMTIYPIAIMPYKPRKRFIYGEAEPTRYIANQRSVNKQLAARTLHALLMAVPKLLVNENMAGSVTNAIGSINKVKMPPNSNVSSAMAYLQPTAMSIDVDKAVDDNINLTMDLAGVNQNIQGAARPENAAALLTQIKQASIPIETYKRRLYKYIEDVGRVWLEFYKTKYNITRKYKDEEGEYEFTGTDFKDAIVNTKTDVGPSTQWSEIVANQMLMDLWGAGVIRDPQQLLKRLPKNSIIDQDGLVQDVETKEVLTTLLNGLIGPENAEQILAMAPEEQLAIIQQQIAQQAGGQNVM